ncbi:SET domain-containing protein [Candidatus Pacearchaeota archaeon]|nr:SET domain-containing protein [Candidatus Pacearchaeota archaeon]
MKTDNLALKKSRKKGFYVVAKKNLKKNQIICQFKGKIYHYKQIKKGSYEDHHSMQISEHHYLGSSNDFDNYTNHSCNPNSGLKIKGKKRYLIAIKNIKKGREIVWDYSTSMHESMKRNHFKLKCRCGSKNCRKIITDFKYLPENLKKKYIKQGIVPTFILRLNKKK